MIGQGQSWPGVAVAALGFPAALAGTAAVAASASLCNPSEQILYSCRLQQSSRLVSVCASQSLDATNGYLQYRFGRPGKIELEYPERRSGSRARFEYAHYFRFQYDLVELRFSNGGVDYVVYSYYDGEEMPAKSETGLRAKEKALACAKPVVNRLHRLEGLIPKGSL